MAEFLSIGAAAFMLGVAISTLRRWDKDSQLVSAYRTPGGHRRYGLCHDVIELMTVFSARLYGSRSHRNQRALTAA